MAEASISIDQVIRTRRKTVALIVERDGRLVVRAPLRFPQAQILDLVRQKADWVRARQEEAHLRAALSAEHRFVEGECFWYLGETHPLAIVERSAPALTLRRCFELARPAQPQARPVFEAWYRRQARQIITERVDMLAARWGLRYGRLRFSSARTRWGSCSRGGTLSFTWRLVMAPLPVIDYVVIHELAHLEHPNHSKAFWARVGEMLPDYAVRRKWLKTYGSQLHL
ncbi:MAG: M48 family metallopeptidase [Anaerolineales bacterium]|nr:M48 family metallopeptidase [Anaerolineales bacterium]